MKQSIFVLLFLAMSFLGFSQFGFQAGATFANVQVKASGLTIKTDSKVGFTAGVVASLPLASAIKLRPELNFVQKGAKVDMSESGFVDKTTLTLNYIEVPVNIVFEPKMASKGKLFLGAGPSLGFGISGKSKNESSNGSGGTTTDKTDIKFGSDENNDDFKSVDFGLNFIGGYQLANGVFFSASYTLGLSDYSLDPDAKQKNHVFAIRLGYMLHGNK